MDPLITNHREQILSIAKKHGAGNVRVFGSRLHDRARSDSDADFLIDIVGPISPWFPGGLIGDLQNLLGCSVDVGLDTELDPAVRKMVLDEATKL